MVSFIGIGGFEGIRHGLEASKRPTPYGNLMMQKLQENIVGQLGQSVRGSAVVESEMLQTLGALFTDVAFVRQQGGKIKAAHEAIGEAARRSTQNAYTHRRFRRPKGSYRLDDSGQNQRYAGGALRRALGSDKGHVDADEYGLRFLNTAVLDQEAKQWRRLNYGAGGKAGTAPHQFPIEWGGIVVATLGLPADPRPAFRIPAGYWIGPDGKRVGASRGGGGSDRFYPVGTTSADIDRGTAFRGRPSPARMTAGIAASNFIDAGVRRIANEIPVAYMRLYSEWHDSNLARMERIAQSAGVRVGSPNEVQYIVEYQRDKNRPRVFEVGLE
jgi:hypothetical protein